jgi:3'5'-cyclic nucleotide phosphodiesterase
LVHDVDHTGVPNSQLAKENPDMAETYRNTSLAEQNSVDLAWGLFMDPRYKKLQDCVAATKEERLRFRQLLVNCVMATDIFEPTMKALRNKRWEKAFHKDSSDVGENTEAAIEEDRNTKATIVIEHIIQASDVAHTMQHWHIYQKWNERLFNEMYSAFECGRAEKNPAESWYKASEDSKDFHFSNPIMI